MSTGEIVEKEAPADKTEQAEKPAKRTLYCARCFTRYTSNATECVTCHLPLEADQPRAGSIFKPAIDIPFLAFAAVFFFSYARLPGEAQSFGAIILVVGLAAIVVFRCIGYAEWLGRR